MENSGNKRVSAVISRPFKNVAVSCSRQSDLSSQILSILMHTMFRKKCCFDVSPVGKILCEIVKWNSSVVYMYT